MHRDKWKGSTTEELLNEEPEFEPVSSAEVVAASLVFLFVIAIAIIAIFGMDSVVSKFQQRQQTNEECRDLRSKNQQQTEGSEEPVVEPKKFSWETATEPAPTNKSRKRFSWETATDTSEGLRGKIVSTEKRIIILPPTQRQGVVLTPGQP